jgi:hypothetical protein
MRTLLFFERIAVWPQRAMVVLPVTVSWPVEWLYRSALARQKTLKFASTWCSVMSPPQSCSASANALAVIFQETGAVLTDE